jgi:hypothetical protein
LSLQLSPHTRRAACVRFTPSNSGQRLPPLSYRGCWHRVSRGLFGGYCLESSPPKGVYNPKAVILHAALLGQGFPHCRKFLAAASRRSLGRVSVPVWLVILSDQLPVNGLVGRYPANNLMGRTPLVLRTSAFLLRAYAGLAVVSHRCPPQDGKYVRVPQPCATGCPKTPRATCMH